MKLKKLTALLTVSAMLIGTIAFAADLSDDTVNDNVENVEKVVIIAEPYAYLRGNNTDSANKTWENGVFQLSNTKNDTSYDHTFIGALSFDLNDVDLTKEIESVTLKLVTVNLQDKITGMDVSAYTLPDNWYESVKTYSAQTDNITAALKEPVAFSFRQTRPNGNYAIFSAYQSNDNSVRNLENWTSAINVTDYVKNTLNNDDTDNKIDVLLVNAAESEKSVQIFTPNMTKLEGGSINGTDGVTGEAVSGKSRWETTLQAFGEQLSDDYIEMKPRLEIAYKAAEPSPYPSTEPAESPSPSPSAEPDESPSPSPGETPDVETAILTLSIDGGEAVEYTSYSDAASALLGQNAKGKTAEMTLLSDIEAGTSRVFIDNNDIKKLTVNGNGHTIKGGGATLVFQTDNSCELILNNLTIDSHTGNDGAISLKSTSKVTMNGVTLTNNKTGIYIQSANASITADNATRIDSVRIRDVALPGIIQKNPAVIINKPSGGDDLDTNMVGTLIGADACELYISGGSIAMRAKKVFEPDENSAVSVTIGDETTYYTSYADAMTYVNAMAIGANAEITLLKDASAVGAVRTFVNMSNILKLTVNGGGYSISGGTQTVLFEADSGGVLELKNISLSDNKCSQGTLSIKGNAVVNLENVKVDKLLLQVDTASVKADKSTVISEYCIRKDVDIIYNNLLLLANANNEDGLSASQILKLTTQENAGANNSELKGYKAEVSSRGLVLQEKQPEIIAKITPTKIANGNYQLMSELEFDDEGYVTIKVKNTDDSNTRFTLYAVEYYDNRTLKSIKLANETIRAGFSKIISMQNPENAQVYMLWADGVTPVVNKMETKDKIEIKTE